MKFGYARVSSKDQNLDRQMEVLEPLGLNKIFKEKISGKDNDRPQLKLMIELLGEGDEVYVKSLDRLARSLRGFMDIWEEVKSKGAKLHIIDLGMTLDDKPMTNFYVTIMAAVSELERGMIRERQREGIALAKEKGIYKGVGRKANTEKHEQIIRLRDKGITVDEIARLVGVNRRTVFRVCGSVKDVKYSN